MKIQVRSWTHLPSSTASNAGGYAVIDDYIPAEDIARAQASVRAALQANGNETVAVFDFTDFQDTFLHDLEQDPAFNALCREIYEAGTGHQAPPSDLVPFLRCLTGASAKAHSMVFHYDTFVLTVILPIISPTEGRTGRLVLLPNTRGVRHWYLRNLVDKVLIDRSSAQSRFRRLCDRNDAHLEFIDMKPGNAYVFWGYRSVHANEACDPDRIRSTAIFHYAAPHADSAIKKVLRR